MPSIVETNVRGTRLQPGTTRRYAKKHPGQSVVQVRNTTESSTLMPAVGGAYQIFIRALCAAHMTICWVMALARAETVLGIIYTVTYDAVSVDTG